MFSLSLGVLFTGINVNNKESKSLLRFYVFDILGKRSGE